MTDTPIIIREWKKNGRKLVRVSLGEYQGHRTVDARIWFEAGDGEKRPGRSGLTVAVRHLPALAAALVAAEAEARRLGLIDDPISGVAT